MPSALFLSPHLDDVAFSCGGTARRLASLGWRTVLCTVFTRSVPDPRGFALACQLDKGLAPDVDYMAERRAEDAGAAACLGSAALWLDLPEAPHRGYQAAAALFGPFVAEDDIKPELHEALAPLLAGHDLVVAPQAIGGHVDHRRVRDAVAASPAAASTVWYRDTPYAIREPAAQAELEVEPPLREVAVALGAADLDAKLDACAAYTTQLGFQFGGASVMRERLTRFAQAEAVRLGVPRGLAEGMLAPPAAATLLTRLP